MFVCICTWQASFKQKAFAQGVCVQAVAARELAAQFSKSLLLANC
jgi:hypothetical protein